MATTGRADAVSADALEGAQFIRVLSRADGDALAASGVLARAFAERGTPFQVSVVAGVSERTARVRDTADETTVVIGAADTETQHLDPTDRPASLTACELARGLGVTPDPVLALAGAVAAGVDPDADETEPLRETARDRGLIDRQPGVAVPTEDLVDGLAYSTWLLAPWSGDREATADAVGELVADSAPVLDEDASRKLGSLVTLDVVGADTAVTEAGTAISRVLRPDTTPAGPFATLGGFADVLEATAETAPGTGVALAMGHDVSTAALEAWREHGKRAHATLEAASTGRYDGVFVVGVDDGPLETVAWLVANYRAPEPLTLVVGDEGAAVVASDGRSVGPIIEASARTLAVDYDVGQRRGTLRFDTPKEDTAVISAVREAV